uniref:Uncharacterized protein n=1 Tax=Arundo donax TaxID=35708 RepID=A0A0A9UHS9_ARUDO
MTSVISTTNDLYIRILHFSSLFNFPSARNIASFCFLFLLSCEQQCSEPLKWKIFISFTKLERGF